MVDYGAGGVCEAGKAVVVGAAEVFIEVEYLD